jgi:hypothetical protein
VLYETTLAGCERRPFANYVFGDIEVPALATDNSPIPPFDMSRTMRLNPQNETVQRIHAFIGMNIERVCLELERQDRERRRSEDVRRLQREADSIADMINQDFRNWRNRISQVLSQTAGANDIKPAIVSGEGDALGGDGDIRTTIILEEGGPHEQQSLIPHGKGSNDSGPSFRETPEGETLVGRAAPSATRRSKSGGFSVDFRAMGLDESRAKYERNERCILINLEHPQIVSALGVGGIDDAAFRRLAYEVAFSEYAIALAVELANEGYFLDVNEPITEIRETMNRLAVTAAVLYR